jgi:hypothetical protein
MPVSRCNATTLGLEIAVRSIIWNIVAGAVENFRTGPDEAQLESNYADYQQRDMQPGGQEDEINDRAARYRCKDDPDRNALCDVGLPAGPAFHERRIHARPTDSYSARVGHRSAAIHAAIDRARPRDVQH